VHERAEGR